MGWMDANNTFTFYATIKNSLTFFATIQNFVTFYATIKKSLTFYAIYHFCVELTCQREAARS